MVLWLYCKKMQLLRNPALFMCGQIDPLHEVCVSDADERTIPVNYNSKICKWLIRRALTYDELISLEIDGQKRVEGL